MKLTIELNDTDDKLEKVQAILRLLIDDQELAAITDDAEQNNTVQEIVDNAGNRIEGVGEIIEQTNQAAGGGGDVTVNIDNANNQVAGGGGATFTSDQPEEIDAAGMPWDERINPKSRAKIKTGKRQGMWKHIKQLEDKQPGLIAKVEAENKARLIAKVHAPETEPTAFEMGKDGQAVAAQVFAAPKTEDPPAEADPDAFGKMLSKLTPRMIEKPEFAEKINAALAAHGVKGLPDLLAKHPHLIPQIDQELDKLWLTV